MAQVHAINTSLISVKVIHETKEGAFEHCSSVISLTYHILQGQGHVGPRPRTFAQGQGQGLKICHRGQLKAKDQSQGQQHCMSRI